jgi:hypothetical protein
MNNYILEKRTTESIWYDIDCTNVLNTNEIITSITSITADQTGLTFSGSAINTAPVTFPDGVTALAGKVISVYISAGIVPTGATNQIYTIRPIFSTNQTNIRESTVLLNVTNIPFQTGRVI